MNTDQNIINQISDAISKEKVEAYSKEQTFFEIIGHTYDEDLVSRYIAYALRTDKTFCEKLIGKVINDKKIAVICEKNMGDGRADIFVETEKYTLTIENKIRSWEHDDQTQTYYDYVQSNYQQKENIYLYLKPNWNQSTPTCKEFYSITYDQLAQYINSDDPKLLDLKKHIEKYFIKEHKMSDKLIAENYEEAKNVYDAFEQFNRSAEHYINSVVFKKMRSLKPSIKYENVGHSYRICDENWGRDNYYFYVELLIENNNLNNIGILGTVWYRPQNSLFADYLKKSNNMAKVHIVNKAHAWFIPFKEIFKSEKLIMSEEWKEELKKFALDNAKLAFEEIEMLFTEFNAFSNNK